VFNHNFPFDPTYGYNEAALLAIGLPDAPDDFASYWQNTFDANTACALNPVVTPSESSRSDLGVSLAEFDTLGGYRIGAWIVYPEEGDIEAGFVASHGYGGRTAPDLDLLTPNAAAIFPCAPGFNLSASNELPSEKMAHVIHGIEDRDSYLIRPCVTSIWSAASLLLELFPNIGSRLYFTGGSFGGGLGALALPWDARFTRAHLKVPTFGHHPIRNTCPCEGSSKAVADYAAAHPEAMETLAYYDAAVAASHIRIPTFSAPALFDPKVPPPGQFAVTNALPPASQTRILQAGHFEHPDLQIENQALRTDLVTFFAPDVSD
jgi:cephalosporin-C deacetylase